MSRAVAPCAHLTLASKHCRRPGRWYLQRGSKQILCWQHGVTVAQNRGVRELIHWITGERRTVPPAPTAPAVEAAPLPTGRDAIVTALNRARTRRALARARYALICDLRSCLERGGLAIPVRDALRAAHARVGFPFTGGTP